MARRDGASPSGGRGKIVVRAVATVTAFVVAAVALAAVVAWVSVFRSHREDASGIPPVDANGNPALSYALVYENGSFDARCYDALSADLNEPLCPPSWNVTSWGLLPEQEKKDLTPAEMLALDDSDAKETGETLSTVAKFVMLDNPRCSAYLRGNMGMDVVGNRYRPEACSDTDVSALLEAYDEIDSYMTANSMLFQMTSEGSDAKYACIAYRLLSESIQYAPTSDNSDVSQAIDSHESGALGLALLMKGLLDANDIPSYVAYGTFVDTGFPYVWNVAWLNDSWFIFDVPRGCEQMRSEYSQRDDEEWDKAGERWAIDSNVASITKYLHGCMASPEDYENMLSCDQVCTDLQLRYESVMSNVRMQTDGRDEEDEDLDEALAKLRYSNLLGTADKSFYDAVTEDLLSGRYIDVNNPETWFMSPVVIHDDNDCTHFAEVASCAMYDNPILSVTNGGGGWTLNYWLKQASVGSISRYFISSEISNSDGNIDMKMQVTQDEAHAIYEQAEAESGGDPRKFVYAAYRDISSMCNYPDDSETSIHRNDAYGALVEGRSKCYGVSCAMKMVLDEKVIPNFIAFGTLKGEGHAWNMVFLDGTWYGCDLTSGSILARDAYAPGTANRNTLDSEINELDSYYYKCMIPSEQFYMESDELVASEMSTKLQALYS